MCSDLARFETGHQWYWAGTQKHTKLLTPDLTQTVSRHVVLKRKVALETFPFTTAGERAALPTPFSPDRERYLKLLREAVVRQFSFHFSAQVSYSFEFLRLVADMLRQIRVKQRFGRLHRLLVASSNEVKAKFLKPHFDVNFSLEPDEAWIDDMIALGTSRRSVNMGVEVAKRVAGMRRQDADTDPNTKPETGPGADDADRHDPATQADEPGQQDPGKTAESSKEQKTETDPAQHEETLEDKVHQACQPPEAPADFRCPFGDTADIDSILDEAKTKASTTSWV